MTRERYGADEETGWSVIRVSVKCHKCDRSVEISVDSRDTRMPRKYCSQCNAVVFDTGVEFDSQIRGHKFPR